VRSRVRQAAAIYCRISHDPSGERLGVHRQEDDCRAEAIRRHWQVTGIYVDDDRSAFNTRKPRPEYQRLLRDIQAGSVDGVLIWRLDRLHRQPRELEEFIVITDKHEVALATVTGDVDLATTQGRLLARAWGAFAAHESEVKSERLKRAFLERARKGVDGWTVRMYGYKADLQTIDPREATVIREAARRILRGESLRSLTIDLNRRKIRSTTGKQWTTTHLHDLLCNPRFAGLSTYRGDIVGKGVWPAIIRPADSARLREHFVNRDNQNHSEYSPNILTGLLLCGRCGAKMVATCVSPATERRRYTCPSMPGRGCGHLSVSASHVEASALQAIVVRVASPEVRARPVRAAVRDRHWLKAEADLTKSQRLLDVLATDLAAGRISRREWLIMRPELAERIGKCSAIVMQDRYDAGLATFICNPLHLTELWPGMHSSRRRTLLRGLIDHIVVRPVGVGQRRYDPTRVIVRWRGDGPYPRTRWLHAPPTKKCRVHGCPRLQKSRGLCHMHYARWQRAGSAGAAGPAANHWFLGRPCKVKGCAIASRSMGWCAGHYARWLDATAHEERCCVEDCERPAEVESVCRRHYNKARYRARRTRQLLDEAADPGLRKPDPCKESGCDVPKFQLGYCVQHYQQWLQASADVERCSFEGCERPRQIRSLCAKHENRDRYHLRAAKALGVATASRS
jgi:site-specific DNA recombinase